MSTKIWGVTPLIIILYTWGCVMYTDLATKYFGEGGGN